VSTAPNPTSGRRLAPVMIEDEQRRFAFGENWARFLNAVDEARITEAEQSLQSMLELEQLDGRTFLDVGCGSGLFSLAAVRLGAQRVHSFDIDAESVACTAELRRRFAPDSEQWTVARGSVLDHGHLHALGTWDVVYSWGVLHHTGAMAAALANAADLVAPGGKLFVAIYNDQGTRSHIWRRVKRAYNTLPPRLRTPYAVAVMVPREMLSAGLWTARLDPGGYARTWSEYKRKRGMSRWHDLIDWVGGYPFEVAKPESIHAFYRERGFTLTKLITCGGGLGCNQFVFERQPL
jgi:2-polyprenyl-3-methyl-5-hydroxy-6-metoxy-1,4-benzoquinol methylase